MKFDSISNQVYIVAVNEARLQSHEFVTPEHFLYAAVMFDLGREIIEESGGNVTKISENLQAYFNAHISKIGKDNIPIESFMFSRMIEIAWSSSHNSGKEEIGIGNLLVALFNLEESFAVFIMLKNGVNRLKMLRYISHGMSTKDESTLESKPKVKNTSDILEKYTIDLTEMARKGQLDPLIGRKEVLDRTIHALCRRTKNNPIHVGDAGVGKTAITEGLAQLIAEGKVPEKLKDATIFSIDMGNVIAGTKYRGDFEERLISVLEACISTPNPIVFIDEIHNIIGAGSVSGGALDASGIIKPYLRHDAIKFIGSTTFEDFKKYFEKDNALTRRFQNIEVPEPTLEESVEILMGIKNKYENFHKVTFSAEIIKHICSLSSKYINDRRLPDKAIDILDETGAYLRINNPDTEEIIATVFDVERIIALTAKIPEKSVSENEAVNLKTLESRIKGKIYGQDEAVNSAVTAVKVSRAGLSNPEKPVASLLFVGPTGVGKTEIARQLAKSLNINLIRFDMSEYQESHSVSRLIGSPPGYVGYEEGGLLTSSIRRTPHAVLLLDEIEKAHPDILNVLLQIMDYGALTDTTGKKADFRNIILIMTSNAGAREIGKKYIGYTENEHNLSDVGKEVQRIFSPEFRNRLDDIITFNHMDIKMATKITLKAINELREKLPEHLTLEITKPATEWISRKGLSKEYGAREIMRVVNKDIVKQLAPIILDIDAKPQKITVSLSENEIKIKQT